MKFKQKVVFFCVLFLCFFIFLHFKTSSFEQYRERFHLVNIYHSVLDRIIYFGTGTILACGAVVAEIGAGICYVIPNSSIDQGEWQFLSELCFSSASTALNHMMNASSNWVRSPEGTYIPRSHRSWHQNRWSLSQIPKDSEEGSLLLSFLEKRWLSKANGFYSSEVNLLCPCFNIDIQVSPVTQNCYARDPFTKFSHVYENCVRAWKQSLPHPVLYPLILTRPQHLQEYLPSCFTIDSNHSMDTVMRQLSLESACASNVLIDVSHLFPNKQLHSKEWFQLWKEHQDGFREQCKQYDICRDRLIFMQRVAQNGAGGIRLLSWSDETSQVNEKNYRTLLSWISLSGLTANIVELDRLPDSNESFENRPSYNDRVCPRCESVQIKIDEFARYVRSWRNTVQGKTLDKTIMINGMVAILTHLIDRLQDDLWDEIFLRPTCLSIIQMSMTNIVKHLEEMREKKDLYAFYDLASSIEQVYLNVLPLLEIFSPFKFEDFSAIYNDVLSFPSNLKQITSCGLFASGMTGLSGIFKAVENTVQGTPRVIYGMNTYFECIQMAHQRFLACSEEEATLQDWEEADLLLVQFNPVLRRDNIDNFQYQIEKISDNIRKALNRDCHKRLTVALDATIDFLASSRMSQLLVEFQREIEEGVLNIVCYRSGLKFDIFGMDNYSGAPFFTTHQKDSYWAPFDVLVDDPALQADYLSLQWFCLAFESAALELDLYRKQIFHNTRELLVKVPRRFFDSDMRYRIVPVSDDVDPSFIDFKVYGPLHEMRAAALVAGSFYLRSMQNGFPLFYRRSFGFYHSNIGVLFGDDCTTIRLTLGLDPAQIDVYAKCIEKFDHLNRPLR